MSPEYPIQIAHTISAVETSAKVLYFQQTAVEGEKVFFKDTGNEYIALNKAGDLNGDFTVVDTNGGNARFTTVVTLPAVGDTVQIMSSSTGAYVGTHTVTISSGGQFTLNVAFSANGTGYWKREATLQKTNTSAIAFESQDLSLQLQISQVNTRNTGLVNIAGGTGVTTIISTIDTAIGTSAEWFVELKGLTSQRAGKIFATSNGTLVQYVPEESTVNVGSTGAGTVDDVSLSVTMSGTVMQLIATNAGANLFTAKYNRLILT